MLKAMGNIPQLVTAIFLLATGLTLVAYGLARAEEASHKEREQETIERILCAREAKAAGKDWLLECYKEGGER
jgi:hypothetical protein